KLLANRLSEGTQAWVVGSAPDWSKALKFLLDIQQILGVPVGPGPEEQEVLHGLRSFGVWTHVGKRITWNADLTAADEDGARKWEEYLTQRGVEGGKKWDLATPHPAALLLRELSGSLDRRRAGTEVRLRAHSSVEALRQALAPR